MNLEEIKTGGHLIASLLTWASQDNDKDKTHFVTAPTHSLQVGVLHKPAGSVVEAHQHFPTVKRVEGCQEVLIIKTGEAVVEIFDECCVFVTRRTLKTGDVFIQYFGGHRFHIITDVQFIEVKQGPYDCNDKVYFNPLCHEQTK